jgi:hypothetical protein
MMADAGLASERLDNARTKQTRLGIELRLQSKQRQSEPAAMAAPTTANTSIGDPPICAGQYRQRIHRVKGFNFNPRICTRFSQPSTARGWWRAAADLV